MLICFLAGAGVTWADSWTRCTAVTDLTSGGTFIIGYETIAKSGKIIPMKNTGGTATTSAAGYMANGSEIDMATVTATADYEFSIVASTTVKDAICIKAGENYIGNTNTKNNCKLFADEAKTTSYGVTVDANDVFTLKIAANKDYHTLQYNATSPRFAVYGGAQKNLVIYKNVTGGGTTTDPDSGDGNASSFVFNTDAGISALGITKPNSGAGTNLGSSKYTSGAITMTTTDGGTATRVWNSSGTTSLRVYKDGGSLTFSGATITKIAFNSNVAMTANVGTLSGSSWEGSASSVTFTATENVTINTIAVTYTAGTEGGGESGGGESGGGDEGGETPDLTLIGIEASGTPAEFWVGDTFNHDGIKINALWDDETELDVTDLCKFSGYDMTKAGEQSVTVTYKGETCTYKINVLTIANGKGTAYTVSKAIELIEAGKDLNTPVYVKGKVSEIVTEFSEQYGNITFNISEDGTTSGQQFQFYRNFKEANKAKWTADDTLPGVGDDVIGYGTLKKYVKDSQVTYEFNEGNYIVDLNATSLKPIAGFIQTREATVNANEPIDIRDYIRIPEDAGYNNYSITTSIGGLTQQDGEFACTYSYVTFLKAGTYTVDVKAPAVEGRYAESTGSIVFTVEMNDRIESLTIEGTPTKTHYYTGERFDMTGLKVMANYQKSPSVDVTNEAELTFDPKTFTEIGEQIAITVLAAYSDATSEVYTYKVSVEKNPYAIAENFEATSGNIDENISYESFKGDATTVPAIMDKCIRLYQNGGYITISGAKGVKISEVILTTGGTYATTTIGTAIEDAEAPTTGTAVDKNSDFKVSNLNCSSISFYCLGTDKNTRLDIAKIQVKYTKVDINLASISISGEGAEFIQNSSFNHDGISVTALYTDQSSADVTTKAEFTEPDMTTVGEKIVNVTYTEGGITKNASYTINVVAESITELHIATLPTKTVFKLGESFNSEGLCITADYNSGRKNIELEATDYEVVAPSTESLGKTEVTVRLVANKEIAESYTVSIVPTNTIFFESFDTNDGTGGNDNQWSGSIASNNIKSDNVDENGKSTWTFGAAKGAYQCAKFGAGSAAGSAVTPVLDHIGSVTVSFKAAAWNGNNEKTTIKVSIADNVASAQEITLTKGAWGDYTVTFNGLTTESKVKFAASEKENNRFFLDEVLITTAAEPAVGRVTNYIEALKNGEEGYTLDGLQKIINDILQIKP